MCLFVYVSNCSYHNVINSTTRAQSLLGQLTFSGAVKAIRRQDSYNDEETV